MADRAAIERLLAEGRPARLNGADLRGLDLHDLDLDEADLSYANLVDASLDGASLRRAILFSATAVRARLDRADLRGANLTAANLRGASLTGARLEGADLSGTDLTDAVLEGATHDPGGLTGAILSRSSTPMESAATDQSGAAMQRLTSTDSGQTVHVPVGGAMEVVLREGATGYRWSVAGSFSAGLGDVVQVDERFEPPGSSAPGALGGRVFRVLSAAPGTGHLVLVLTQPWDPQAAPADRFELTIEVG